VSRCEEIGLYAGKGTSHSWLWFVECLEKFTPSIRLLDETDIRKKNLESISVIIIPGGDTISMAHAMGKDGLSYLHNLIKSGATYMGSCAGAYLPLKSSLKPLSHFNLVRLKVENLVKDLPISIAQEYKFSVPYGCRYVIHPVRGEMALEMDGSIIHAPLYGGPSFSSINGDGGIKILARYCSFTSGTEFLVDRDTASSMLIGKPAVVKFSCGSGDVYLLGPHLEHPSTKEGNQWIRVILSPKITTNQDDTSEIGVRRNLTTLASVISDLMVAGTSFYSMPIFWKIGIKTWEPEKLHYFIDAIWKRLKWLIKLGWMVEINESEHLEKIAGEVLSMVKEIRSIVKDGKSAREEAEIMFERCRILTKLFLENYFATRQIVW
jgi:glutamine amidotransferase-like uncharacterized protein